MAYRSYPCNPSVLINNSGNTDMPPISLMIIYIPAHMQKQQKVKTTCTAKLKYKAIRIQELEPRPQIPTAAYTVDQLYQNLNKPYQWVDDEKSRLFYTDSGIGQQRIVPENGLMKSSAFFTAFLHAYMQHGNVALVPDEVWIMILFYVTKYVDNNAQALRKKFVSFRGKMELVVVERVNPRSAREDPEKRWDKFFDEMISLMKKNTVKGVVQKFQCDFSTTNKQYRFISTALVMNSFKSYFDYHRFLAGCGIRNVYMAGVRQDWAKMIPKLKSFLQYDVDGKLKTYIEHMQVILENFLLTFDEKPDLQFWNTIMKTGETLEQYGGELTQVEGWILHFYGIYEKHSAGNFPDYSLNVPIILSNSITMEKKDLVMVADWNSISKVDEETYKPDVGLSIAINKKIDPYDLG